MMNTLVNIPASQPQIEHEWDRPGRIPDKPAGSEYGYVINGQVVECSREELMDRFADFGTPAIKFVWTPETPQPVLPEKVPLLTAAFKRRSIKAARKAIYLGVGLVAFGLVLALASADWQMLYRNFLSVLGGVALVDGIWELYRTRHYTQEDAESAASSARFAEWVNKKALSGYTIGLAALIIIVGLGQVLAGLEESIKAAGLVKPAVRQGEVWRLFTCCLMHASFMHFWMNFLALLQLGRLMEQTIQRAYVPTVFLLSGVCGSVFSLFLYPQATSVGASGGLMGLIGFLTVAAYINRENFPPKYFRHLIEAIAFVGILGIIGFAFIDNAGHLGGLCGGLALGWFVLKHHGHKKSVWTSLRLLGIISLILTVAVALTCLWQMFKQP